MPTLKRVVERVDTPWGRAFDFSIQFLIVFSLITSSIETLPSLSESTRRWLWRSEVFAVAIFTIEYLLRLIVADKKRAFVFSFYGMIDLFAILPFYISSGLDLRAIRILRLFRLFRVVKIVRYSRAIQRYKIAFMMIREELALFFTATVMLLYFAAVGIYTFENQAQPEAFSSVFDSLWWAVITLTTVGYGDVFPITIGGKIFTFVILMVGLGVVAVPTSLLSSALTQARELERDQNAVKTPE